MLQEGVGIAKMTLKRISQANRRGAGNIVDETHGFGTGFGCEGYRELQADLCLWRKQRIAAFDIGEGEFGGAVKCVARSLDAGCGLAELKLRELLLAQRRSVVGGSFRLAEIDRGPDRGRSSQST